MAQEEPTRATILIEIAVFAALFILVGALLVAVRAVREGPRVMNFDSKESR